MPFQQSGPNASATITGTYNDVSGNQYNGGSSKDERVPPTSSEINSTLLLFETKNEIQKMKHTYFCIAEVKAAEGLGTINTTCNGALEGGKHITNGEGKGEMGTIDDKGKEEAVSTNSEEKKEIGSMVPSNVGDYFLQIGNQY